MIFVLHMDEETAQVRIDGRLFSIPPNELFEVPDITGTDCNNNGPTEYRIPEKQVAAKIIEHCWYHGMVEVPMTRTKGGVTSDIEAARKAARTALELAHDTMLNKYVTDQQERLSIYNKPALAPSTPIMKIIERRGIDLDRDFGIKPPGFDMRGARDRDAEMEELKKQIAELRANMSEPEGKRK